MNTAESLQAVWLNDVVPGVIHSETGSVLGARAASCLRERLHLDPEALPSPDRFFVVLDDLAVGLRTAGSLRERVAALDRDATAAFIDCAKPFYSWLAHELAAEREAFEAAFGSEIDKIAERFLTLGLV